MAKTYTLHVAGLTRELPICKINDHLDIAAFIMFSDVELTIACAKALLEKCPDFDVILTAPERQAVDPRPQGCQGVHGGSCHRGGSVHHHRRQADAGH